MTVTPADEAEVRELDIVEHKGRIGFDPHFPAAVIGVPRHDSPAGAGLRTFDLVTAVNGRRIERFIDLVDALAENRGDQVVVSYLRPVDVPRALGRPLRARRARAGRGDAHAACRAPPGPRRPADENARAADVLARTGIESADMYVAFVPAGVERVARRAAPGRPHHDARRRSAAALAHDGGRARGRRRPDARAPVDARRRAHARASSSSARSSGTTSSASTTSATSSAPTTGCRPRPTASSPTRTRSANALRQGVEETGSVIKFIAIGMLRLVQGRVSLSSVSGPITMYDIAGQAGAQGTDVLRLGDGGHLGEPRAHQPAAHPGARRRPPALLPVRGGAPAAAPAAHPRGGEPRGDGDARPAHARRLQERRRAAVGRHRHCRCASSGRDPRGARDVAARVLVRVAKDRAFAAAALEAELARAVQLEPRDRALATELVYGTLRVEPWLAEGGRAVRAAGHRLDRRARARAPRARGLPALLHARARLRGGERGRRGGEERSGAAHGRLRQRGPSQGGARAPRPSARRERDEAIVASTPAWLREASRARALDAGGGAGVPAGRDRAARGRARGSRIARASATRGSRRSGAAAPDGDLRAGRVSPRAILARGAGKPAAPAGLGRGRVDGAGGGLAARGARRRGARPARRVLDACAGRGNKTGVLARAVVPGGRRRRVRLRAPRSSSASARSSRASACARAPRFAVDWTVGSGDVDGDVRPRPRRRAVHAASGRCGAAPRSRSGARPTDLAARTREQIAIASPRRRARAPGRVAGLRRLQRAPRGGGGRGRRPSSRRDRSSPRRRSTRRRRGRCAETRRRFACCRTSTEPTATSSRGFVRR